MNVLINFKPKRLDDALYNAFVVFKWSMQPTVQGISLNAKWNPPSSFPLLSQHLQPEFFMKLTSKTFGWMTLWLLSVQPIFSATITFTIDPSTSNGAITPYTYGSNSTITGVNNTYYRSGGNRLTAYNWETNWSNAGSDWLYENDTLMGDTTDGPAGAFTSFHQTNKARSADTLVTLQLAGFVSADKSGVVPVSQYAPPAGTRFFPAYLVKPGAPSSYAATPDTTDSAVYVDECVNYLVNKLGTAANGGIKFYDLDNEPGAWSSTHQEIRNNDPAGYAELTSRSATLAYQTTAIDPGAQIMGPVGYGWNDFMSLSGAPDASTYDATYNNGNWVPFLNYYLASMNSASVTAGRRLLHYLDCHAYSEGTDAAGNRINNDDVSQDAATTRMQLPREMWDPTFTENNWITCCITNYGPMTLIPRLQAAVSQYYPGTKLAFTEYSYGAEGDISGGIAQADALGIFGKYGVMASNWVMGSSTTYLAAAFNLYLNYDGSGSLFGDTSVSATSNNVPSATVYAAKDNTHPNRLNVIVLNKDYSTNNTASVTLTGLGSAQISSIRAFRFSSAVSVITSITAPTFTANTFTDTLPFRSATLYEITLSTSFTTFTPTYSPTITATPTVTSTRTSTATYTFTPTGTLPTSTSTATRTSTPTTTSTPTATVVCASLFNGCESMTENGTWNGTNASQTLSTTDVTQGNHSLQVNVTTANNWNIQIMNLSGFTPNVWSGVAQVVMDVYVSSSLISSGSTWHQLTLLADSAAIGQQPIADSPNINVGANTVTFNISFAGAGFPSTTALTQLYFVYNTDSTGTGSFYVDNIRLIQNCGGTSTATPLVTSTFTPTRTLTRTPSASPTKTSTSSSTPTATSTLTLTRTDTSTATATGTATLASITNTFTPSVTSTLTSTNSRTSTPTATPTFTLTRTNTLTATASATATPVGATFTFTQSTTSTATPTSSATGTSTSTRTATPTFTFTATSTVSSTPTWSVTGTQPATNTETVSPTPSLTNTSTPSSTPTRTSTSTFSSTATETATSTFTVTSTHTPTHTATPSDSATNTSTPGASNTWTATDTASPTPTATQTYTITVTSTSTVSRTPSATVTLTTTVTVTSTPTITSTVGSPTLTPMPENTPSSELPCESVNINVAYPNPVIDASVPVKIVLSSSCQVKVKWSIFTSSYRMISGGEVTVLGKTEVSWDQKDLKGHLVSNGLYHFILRDKSGKMKKISILVLR
jgi:mannan endo-1,4-beta-mannosidase